VDEYISVAGQPRAVAVGAGSVWVLCDQDGKVERIDPKTNKVI
jgi:streptogramin lyase